MVVGAILFLVLFCLCLCCCCCRKDPSEEEQSLTGKKSCWTACPFSEEAIAEQRTLHKMKVQKKLEKVLEQKIFFSGGSHKAIEESPRNESIIGQIADILKQNDDIRICIEGHTDADNKPLSEDRAIGVRKALENHGIDSSRMEVEGMSNKRMIPGGVSSKRVEMKVLGLEKVEDPNYK